MFPDGLAGVALSLLRCIVATTTLIESSACRSMGTIQLVQGIAAFAALCLLPGFLTPYAAAVCCLLDLTLLLTAHAPGAYELVTSALTAIAASVLGPGAYSVDARLFGRKLIEVPPRRDSR